jgi:hypothetical protein
MRKETSSAFLKKSAQKTFAKLARAHCNACSQVGQKFFLLFFKREVLASFYWGA